MNSGKGKKRVAWGITGSGDKIVDIVNIMKDVKKKYKDVVEISVYLSKAGNQVAKYYKLIDDLKVTFERIRVEIDSNSPFLAGQLQTGRFEFLLIAPVTSNTVAKISIGIADSLLSNSAIMALKAFIPVYLVPSDYREGLICTKLPSGQVLKLRIRKEDMQNVKKLSSMEDVFILMQPEDIFKVFRKHFEY